MIQAGARNIAEKETVWAGIINRKLEKPVVVIFLLLVSLFASYVVARQGLDTGLILFSSILAAPLAYASVVYPRFGIVALIICSFFVNYSSRYLPEPTPIGLVIDVLTYLLILGFFIKKKNGEGWAYFNDPISWFVLVWIGYNLFEIINPNAVSILAWVFTVRTVGFIMLMYFIFLYHIRSVSFIRLLLKLWLGLALVGAISALQQEFIGLFPFEHNWLHRYPMRYELLFIGGHLRKWGIFSDPPVLAYNMIAASLICLSLLFKTMQPYKKVILTGLIFIYLMAMFYTGTRAAYVLLPSSLIMLAILKFNKKLIYATVVTALFLGILIKIPSKNPSLVRFQTAFAPSKDASFNVRAENQKRIQPYILTHPIGGGLGSTGLWGERFAPHSFLASFPPDSGYVRVAVEMGWVGLLIFCIFNFVILNRGIYYYYLIKDPELKTYCMAMVLIIFGLNIGNYPQQAFIQYPTNILFFLATAILNVTMRLDRQKNEQLDLIALNAQKPSADVVSN